MLPREVRIIGHVEVRSWTTQRPVHVTAVAVQVVDRVSVARRHEQRSIIVDGDGVPVEVVVRLVLGARALIECPLRLGHRDVVERAPVEQHLARGDVDLLDDTVPDPAIGLSPDLGEIRLSRDIGDEEHRVLVRDRRLVQVDHPMRQITAHAHTGHFLVRLVDDDHLALGQRCVDDALPPREHGLVLILLHPHVPARGGFVRGFGLFVFLEPDRLALGVDDGAARPLPGLARLGSQEEVLVGPVRVRCGQVDLRCREVCALILRVHELVLAVTAPGRTACQCHQHRGGEQSSGRGP